jgi:hypothetical protein
MYLVVEGMSSLKNFLMTASLCSILCRKFSPVIVGYSAVTYYLRRDLGLDLL